MNTGQKRIVVRMGFGVVGMVRYSATNPYISFSPSRAKSDAHRARNLSAPKPRSSEKNRRDITHRIGGNRK